MATNIDNSQPTKFPTVAELRRLVKKRERARFSAMWFLEPIQVYFSYALIRLGLNSIGVTVLWLFVAFAGYAAIAVGTPAAMICGALLLYLKTILDGADGEVARFQKQFISPREDLESFIHGVYLDKVFHIIEKPLWGLSLGFGLYRQTGDWWIFAAGLCLSIFHGFCRHNGVVRSELPYKFQKAVKNLLQSGESEFGVEQGETKDSIPVRVLDKLVLWIRNGKRLNAMFLISATFDLFTLTMIGPRGATYGLMCIVGVLCPILATHMIVRTLRTNQLLVAAAKVASEK